MWLVVLSRREGRSVASQLAPAGDPRVPNWRPGGDGQDCQFPRLDAILPADSCLSRLGRPFPHSFSFIRPIS
jgi:hypothetical protein